ncbi:MAG: serine/threonine-protein kinase [Gemmatimonas sp.]
MTDFLADVQTALGPGYRLERELGGGGMSRVFVAEEVALGRRVVVKTLAPEVMPGASVDRFHKEMQTAAQLQHPAIVPLLGTGSANGITWFTMPFVAGDTLRDRLQRDGALPIADVVRLSRDLFDALSAAHAAGVMHRDIKPENLFLSGRHMLVADFGVARALSMSTQAGGAGNRLTVAGMAVGTPAYMAPEQALGDDGADHRVDIYAAGLVMYEMLCGALPFKASTPQQMVAAHLSVVPAPISERRDDVPAALSELVMRCLAKDPDDRPASASEAHDVLDQITLNTTTPAPTSGSSRAATAPTNAKRFRVSGVWVGVAALVIGSVSAVVFWKSRLVAPQGQQTSGATTSNIVLSASTSTGADATLTALAAKVDDAITQQVGTLPWIALRTSATSNDETATLAAARTSGAVIVATSSLLSTGSDSVQLRLRLIDPANGSVIRQLTSISFSKNATPADIARGTEQFVVAMGFATHPHMGVVTIPSTLPPLEAFRAFAQAIDEMIESIAGGEVIDRIMTPLNRAIASDSSFRQAKLWLGFTYSYYFFISRSAEGRGRVDEFRRWIDDTQTGGTAYEKAFADMLRRQLGETGDQQHETTERLVSMNPRSPFAYLLPSLLEDQKRYKEAGEQYLKLLHPEDKRDTLSAARIAQYWGALGNLRHTMGDYEQALAAWDSARAVRPSDLSALTGYLQALAAMGRFEDINRELPKAGSASGNGMLFAFAGNLYLTVGNELVAHGHPVQGDSLYRKAADWFALHDGSEITESRLKTNFALRHALTLMAVHRANEAKPLMYALLKSDSLDIRAIGMLGRILADEGNTDSTNAILQRLSKLDAASLQGAATYERAAITAHLGRDHWEEAVQLLETSLREGSGYNIRHRLHWFSDWIPLKDFPSFVRVAGPKE